MIFFFIISKCELVSELSFDSWNQKTLSYTKCPATSLMKTRINCCEFDCFSPELMKRIIDKFPLLFTCVFYERVQETIQR